MAWEVKQRQSAFEPEEIGELKMQLARIIARDPSKRYSATSELFPNDEDRGKVFEANSWLQCPEVNAEVDRLIAAGEVGVVLPTQETVAHEVLTLARSIKNPKDKLAAYKLHAEMRGMIKKPETTINNVNDNSVRVLRVPAFASQEQFEERLEAQQVKLLADARSD